MTRSTGRSEADEPAHQHGDAPGFSADTVFDRAFWEARYGSADAVWSGRPNPQLVAEAGALTPGPGTGRALDLGCGEGADAVWLAERGWQVVATDISSVALERAEAHARTLGPEIADRISWRQADITTEALPDVLRPGAYDLVSAQFMHLPSVQRRLLHRRLAEATAPGGLLLVVGHHSSDLDTTMPRPNLPDLFFTASDVAAALPPGVGWEVLVDAARARPATDPEGRAVTLHDAVLTARRAPAGS